MEITVNQQNYIVPDSFSVQLLLTEVLHRPVQGIAVAINENVVPRTQWGTHTLMPGDNIIIIKATQGG